LTRDFRYHNADVTAFAYERFDRYGGQCGGCQKRLELELRRSLNMLRNTVWVATFHTRRYETYFGTSDHPADPSVPCAGCPELIRLKRMQPSVEEKPKVTQPPPAQERPKVTLPPEMFGTAQDRALFGALRATWGLLDALPRAHPKTRDVTRGAEALRAVFQCGRGVWMFDRSAKAIDVIETFKADLSADWVGENLEQALAKRRVRTALTALAPCE